MKENNIFELDCLLYKSYTFGTIYFIVVIALDPYAKGVG